VKVGVGEFRIPPFHDTKNYSRPFGFLRAQRRASPAARLTSREVEYAGPVAGIHRLEQGTSAGQLDVVAMGGDGQDIYRHGGK
jgi:hypothetical protein